MLESKFQADVIKRLEARFPGCIVLKNDSGYRQGIPDLTVLFGNRWAALEIKRSAKSPSQPNQEYYIDTLGAMSYAAFVSPENLEEVLDDLQQTFRPRRAARVSQR